MVEPFIALNKTPPFQIIVPELPVAVNVNVGFIQLRVFKVGIVTIGGGIIEDCVMLSILAYKRATSEALIAVGLTEIYLTHPAWFSQGTNKSSKKKLIGVEEVAELYKLAESV